MEEFNLIGEIIKFILSIVAPLVVAYVTNRKTTEESKFFSYITLVEENFVKKTKRKSNILMITFLLLHLINGLNGTLYSLAINQKVSEKAEMIGLILLVLLTVGQGFCIFVLAFSDVKYFDEEMRKKKRHIYDMDEWINKAITMVCIGGLLIVLFYRKNADAIFLIAYVTILITVGMEAIYNSFISLYVKVRRWYHVKEIIIRTKTNKNSYRNIFNYRKCSDIYEFVCEEENELKRICIPIDEVESIEKIIDTEKTYLDKMREKEVNTVKNENKKNGFWRDFANQNKAIVVTGFIAVVFCLTCVFLKSSSTLNVGEKIYPWGEFLFNVAISVIAAVIFFVVQVYMPNRKREQTLKKYAKRYIKEVLLSECNILKVRTESICKGEHSEGEIKEAINSSCVKIKKALNESLNNYLQVLSEELIEAINSVWFDDMFYMISIRANGTLVNESLEKILLDQINYQLLWDKVDKIKLETEKL